MIVEPTTLVLGAGASKPYGFPLGSELRRLLCDRVSLGGMSQLGFDQRDLNIFSNTFLKSEMPSIDAFLARRGGSKVGTNSDASYADIGKAAIAYCLIQRELPESLNLFSDDHWYQYLWSFMADSLDSFGENKLRIITFNYDRSLEFYLLTALQHSFGISAQEAALHLQKIPILHVYGQLAAFPEWSADGEISRSYATQVSPSLLSAAARGIRVIEESRDDDKVFDQAYSYLIDAKKICFLGFGFDETNVRRLRISELIRNAMGKATTPRVFATTLGLKDAERRKIMGMLDPSGYGGRASPLREEIGSYGDLKAEQYLRAAGVFIS